jgi:hypothetical protein
VNIKGVFYIVGELNEDILSGTGGLEAAWVQGEATIAPALLLADAAGGPRSREV